MLVSLDKGFLGHVLGLRRAAGHPPGQVVNQALVALYQLRKGRLIALPAQGDPIRFFVDFGHSTFGVTR